MKAQQRIFFDFLRFCIGATEEIPESVKDADWDVLYNIAKKQTLIGVLLAAEFLVPADVLREMWNNNIKKLSHQFKVSEIVVARRAHDLGLLSDTGYRNFWMEYSHRPVAEKKKSGGGDFYLTSVKRVGKLFAIHVRNAVNSRQLEYTEAYRLTGLSGKTYQHFMTNNI